MTLCHLVHHLGGEARILPFAWYLSFATVLILSDKQWLSHGASRSVTDGSEAPNNPSSATRGARPSDKTLTSSELRFNLSQMTGSVYVLLYGTKGAVVTRAGSCALPSRSQAALSPTTVFSRGSPVGMGVAYDAEDMRLGRFVAPTR